MTTQIVPGSGQGALLTQQGPGTSPGYSALDIRRLFSGALQEGVYGTSTTVTAGGVSGVAAADFMVTQRGSGADLSVDINMPGGGMAFVQGDTIAGQGLYGVPVASANINEAIAAADLSKPRIDSVILEVQDNVLDASGGNLARTRVLTGTPTASATLSTRAGAPTLPGSALLLADVLVPISATTIPNSNIRDRRKWARGYYCSQLKQNGAVTNASTSSAADIDSTLLNQRFEASGVPVEVELHALGSNSTAGSGVVTFLNTDGSASAAALGSGTSTAANQITSLSFEIVTGLSAGSHVVKPQFLAIASATATIDSDSHGVWFTVREVVRINTPNNVVTTG